MAETNELKTIFAKTIFGANTRKGLVVIEYEGKEVVTLEPVDARALALNILEASEGATTDEFMYRFGRRALGMDETQAAQTLLAFRGFRQSQRPGLSAGRAEEPNQDKPDE